MAPRARWTRSLRREWQHQWSAHPGRVRSLLLIWLLLSGSLAGLLWQQRLRLLQARQTQQMQTDLGLLELRINSHRITALDWGHWDPLYNYASGEDPDFAARELDTSSILEDGQMLLLVDRQQRTLLARGDLLEAKASPALRRCLQMRLEQLALQATAADLQRAYGFLCQAGAQSVLGAGTAILHNDGQGPGQGWMLHFSRLQRPSYNAAVNSVFNRINGALNQHSDAKAIPATAVSELLPRGQALSLQPPVPAWRQRLLALQDVAPGWIGLNTLLLMAGSGTLLTLRQLRLRDLLLQRARHQPLRGLLLSRRELLQRIEQLPPSERSELWIAALQVTVMMLRDAVQHRSHAQRRAMTSLVEQLQRLSANRHLALGEDETLLQVLEVNENDAGTLHHRIEQELEMLQQAMADAMQLSVSGVLTRLDSSGLPQQLTDLNLLLAHSDSPGSVQQLPEGVSEQARQLRERVKRDFNLTRSIETLQEHRCRLEPVMALTGAERKVVYSEMLFRLPEDLEGSISVQELVLALERNNNIHLLDQLMLRRAISLLREENTPEQRLGVNISALSFSAEKHLQTLLAQLRSLPENLRRRLVLEVTETALLQKPDVWSQRLQQLRDLGIAIAIDDFGVGFASIAYLFQVQPDFLKLDLSYTQRLHDAKVNALVDFLLRYSELNSGALILEGIETEEQLQYWQTRGVQLFQGYWFHR